jgi:iron complex transport system substrate-binding protein
MRSITPRLAAPAAALALITAAACGTSAAGTGSRPAHHVAAGAFPAVVTAANGRIRVPARPAAIVSLSPTATEMLYAIGAGPQVKAVDQYSDYPPGTPRTKLSGLSPNVEAIIAYKPNLVVTSSDTGGLTKRLAAFSIPVLDLPAPADLAGVYAEFAQLGQATGHLATARRAAATLRSQVSQVVAAAPRHGAPATYYYELDQTYYTVTSSTFIGKLLGLLGMKSIADSAKGAAASGGYPQLSPEYIIKANPAFIILADTICCHQSAATVAHRPGWASLAAVRKGHVISLSDDVASRWGPRLVILLRTVLAALRRGR